MRTALALVLLLAGCGEPRTTLRARIDSTAPIVALQVRVGIGGGMVGAAQTIPPKVPGDLLVILPDVATAVTLDVVGTTASGDFLSGTASTMSIPHEEVLVAITLGGPAGDGMMMSDASRLPDGGVADQTMTIADGAIPDLTMPAIDQTMGKTFVQEPSTTQDDLSCVFGSGPNDIYAAGNFGALVHSTGNGKWQGQNTNTGQSLFGGLAVAADDLYIVGSSETILHSTGNGTWTAQTTPGNAQLTGIWAASPTDLYATGDTGTVLHSTGGGATWTLVPTPTMEFLFAIWGSSPTDIWVGGNSGAIFHTTDHGMTWQDYTINSGGADVNTLWGSGANEIFGAMDYGNFTRWDGMNWAPIFQTQAMAGLESVWGTSGTDVWMCGDGIIHSANHGGTWDSVFGQGLQYFNDVWGSGPGDVYAVGKSGIVFHYK
jgi:photosystem II stability/assembly factor-like uncharacterized protein